MSYTILKSDSSLLPTTAGSGVINDNTLDSSTSLDLVGRNYAGYGQYVNRNFVKLLENFSSASAPANPIVGQIWWQSAERQLKVYQADGTWKIVSNSPATATAPSNPITGDVWWNTSTLQFLVYSGAGWVTIGPTTAAGAAVTGLIGDSNNSTDGSGTHYVGNVVVNNKLTGIFSSDNVPFAPAVSSLGFTSLIPGLNLGTGLQVLGNAIIGNITASNISSTLLSSGTISSNAVTVTGNITAGNIGATHYGNAFGTTAVYSGNVTALNINANQYGNSIGTTATYSGNVTAGNISTGKISAASATFSGNVSFTGNVVLPTVVNQTFTSNIVPSANLTYNLGSSTNWWNNIYGTAVHAQYADLAERFEADTEYVPGTVVEIGGPAEITAASLDLSEEVFGVISTKAAYLMNSGAGNDSTHPPVAVQGRVPVRVTGTVRKGDRLVSAGNGMARAGKRSEITTWNVIGRALEDKTTPGEGIVEAVVKLNS